MCLRDGVVFFNFRKFVYIFQLFVYNFSKKKLPPLKRILALPTYVKYALFLCYNHFFLTFLKWNTLQMNMFEIVRYLENDVRVCLMSDKKVFDTSLIVVTINARIVFLAAAHYNNDACLFFSLALRSLSSRRNRSCCRTESVIFLPQICCYF